MLTVLVLSLLVAAVPLLYVNLRSIRHPALLVIPAALLAICLYGRWQTLEFWPSVLNIISPRAATIRDHWIPTALNEYAANSTDPDLKFCATVESISVAPFATKSVVVGPLMACIMFLIAWSSCRTRESCRFLLIAFALGGTVFSTLGLIDRVRPPEVEERLLQPVGAPNPFGSFVNRNNAAGFLNLTLGCAVGWTVYELLANARKKGVDRRYDFTPENFWQGISLHIQRGLSLCNNGVVTGIILSALTLTAILATGSRGGSLAAFAAAIVVLLQTLPLRQGMWASSLTSIIVIGAALTLGFLGMLPTVHERLETVLGEDALSDARIPHWRDAMVAAWGYFPWGSGFGTYRYAYLPYQHYSAGAWFINADNLAVEWLVEGGLFGAGLIVLAIVFAIRNQLRFKALHTSPHITSLKAMGWFIIISQIVSQLFDFGLILPSNYLTLAVLLGALAGVIESEDRRENRRRGHRVSGRRPETTWELIRSSSWKFNGGFIVGSCLVFGMMLGLNQRLSADATVDYWQRELNQQVTHKGIDQTSKQAMLL